MPDGKLDVSSLESWLWDAACFIRDGQAGSIGDRAEEIAETFEQRRMTTQQTLGELEKLVCDLKPRRRPARIRPSARILY